MNIKSILKGDDQILDTFKGVASGSDRHCLNVSILCESVCKDIDDINDDNLIVAARLHDIGKCCNPSYFSENQDQTNIHDDLDPTISYQYISRHIADSVLKLIQMGAPADIIRIVSEHHGDSVISAIYHKAKSEGGRAIEKDFFRYKSNKPSSKESCILMICDVVESATRALSNAGKLDDPKSVIEGLINKMVDDEQLDLLTLGHVRIVKKVLLKETDSIYHKRVDYDAEKEKDLMDE